MLNSAKFIRNFTGKYVLSGMKGVFHRSALDLVGLDDEKIKDKEDGGNEDHGLQDAHHKLNYCLYHESNHCREFETKFQAFRYNVGQRV